MSLASQFPGLSFEEWARRVTPIPAQEHPLPDDDMHKLLLRLHYDPLHNDPVRYPRAPPTNDEWAAHLDKLEANHVYLEQRSFDQDSEALVEAEAADEQCANGQGCVAFCCHELISGLERRGGIVLKRLPPPHAPFCVLCHRHMLVKLTIADRRNRNLINAPSELARPGPDAYVLKQLRPVQTFYNLRDERGEYGSDFVFVGGENDLVVLPMARTNLQFLFAAPIPGSSRFRIHQDALRFVYDPETDVHPGETVHQLKERVRPCKAEPLQEWE
jgi:hypothetical protein